MQKVIFILHIPPPIHGSAIVGKIIKDSTLINNSIQSKYINLGTSRSLEVIGKKPFQKIGVYLKIVCQTLIQLMFFKPDLIYIALTAKGKAFYKDAFIALLAKVSGKKIVYHLHNRSMAERQHKWLDVTLCNMIFKNTNVILLSKYLYLEIKKYVPIRHVHICPNGIPQLLDTVAKRKKVSSNDVQVLFLSNLMLAKGVFVLLDALEILKKRQLAFHCTFIGGESDISEELFQAKVMELGLSDYVQYAGKKYGEEKHNAFSSADIFVLPTLNETFGLVNLEAMQYSLPVISTLEGGIPDVVKDGETGFLVDKNDRQDLADKLEMLIKNPELRIQMGQLGRKHYEEYFTLEIFEQRFLEIINKILLKSNLNT